MREIDTKAYLSALREMVREGHDVNLIISGSSMAAFIMQESDTNYFGQIGGPCQRGSRVCCDTATV